jgi:hypothetical protein
MQCSYVIALEPGGNRDVYQTKQMGYTAFQRNLQRNCTAVPPMEENMQNRPSGLQYL